MIYSCGRGNNTRTAMMHIIVQKRYANELYIHIVI